MKIVREPIKPGAAASNTPMQSPSPERGRPRPQPDLPAARGMATRFWTAVAERSGDTALASRGAEQPTMPHRSAGGKSGVALRFPPQSKRLRTWASALRMHRAAFACLLFALLACFALPAHAQRQVLFPPAEGKPPAPASR